MEDSLNWEENVVFFSITLIFNFQSVHVFDENELEICQTFLPFLFRGLLGSYGISLDC